jgi:hypothetical protein
MHRNASYFSLTKRSNWSTNLKDEGRCKREVCKGPVLVFGTVRLSSDLHNPALRLNASPLHPKTNMNFFGGGKEEAKPKGPDPLFAGELSRDVSSVVLASSVSRVV